MTTLSEEENKLLSPLFWAIYFNDIDKVEEFKSLHPELYAKKTEFLLVDAPNSIYTLEQSLPFNLVNLTQLNQYLWGRENWIEQITPLVVKQRQNIEKMLAFWRSEFGHDQFFDEIQYDQYYYFFYCSDPSIYHEISEEPISDYLAKGFKEIDLILYNRVECFDFAATKRLLDQGANVDVDIDQDGDAGGGVFLRILLETSYLSSCCVIPKFKYYEGSTNKEAFYQNAYKINIEEALGELIGYVAHGKMYDLLEPFHTD